MEKKIIKQVEIKDIKLDEELYPRSGYDWKVAYDYSQSLLTGAEFPKIILAIYDGKLILVDGKHRIEAYKMVKRKTIKAEVHTGWSKNKIFEQAIKTNIAHGRTLSPFDKRKIALRLRQLKYPEEMIGNLIQVPIGKLNNFIGGRLVNSITGESMIIKSEIQHIAGEIYEAKSIEEIEQAQKKFYSCNQLRLIEELISLTENKLLDRENKKIKPLLIKLKGLL